MSAQGCLPCADAETDSPKESPVAASNRTSIINFHSKTRRGMYATAVASVSQRRKCSSKSRSDIHKFNSSHQCLTDGSLCAVQRTWRTLERTVGRIRNWTIAVLTAGLLASCATPPPPPPPPPPAPKAELPYKWTQGNAPKAYEDLVATFGRVALSPGDFRWAAAIPETGDTEHRHRPADPAIYVYRGEQLVGMSTISSGKKGRETPVGFWAVRSPRR